MSSVGRLQPRGRSEDRVAAPLDRVAGRIRPEYLRRWLANPKSQLPYTAMPVNFPPEKSMGHEIYPASVEQLDAVLDLLINYDRDVQGCAGFDGCWNRHRTPNRLKLKPRRTQRTRTRHPAAASQVSRRVGRAKRAPPFLGIFMVGLASLDPPYHTT